MLEEECIKHGCSDIDTRESLFLVLIQVGIDSREGEKKEKPCMVKNIMLHEIPKIELLNYGRKHLDLAKKCAHC